MFNFLNKVIKARQEWLSTPNKVPHYHEYLRTAPPQYKVLRSKTKT